VPLSKRHIRGWRSPAAIRWKRAAGMPPAPFMPLSKRHSLRPASRTINPMIASVKTLKKILGACSVAISLLTAACAFRGEFDHVQKGRPFALLTAEKGASFRDRGPTVFSINSHPTSFWRTNESFRISPGETVLTVVADREPYDFVPLRFSAVNGRHYLLRYGDQRQSVALFDVTNRGESIFVARSRRTADRAN